MKMSLPCAACLVGLLAGFFLGFSLRWQGLRCLALVVCSIGASVAVRIVITYASIVHMPGQEWQEDKRPFGERFWTEFFGTDAPAKAAEQACGKSRPSTDRQRGGEMLPILLGALETGGYAVLLSMDPPGWTVIGAWLVLKLGANWSKWSEVRALHNRFILGSGLVIAAAWVLSRALVL